MVDQDQDLLPEMEFDHMDQRALALQTIQHWHWVLTEDMSSMSDDLQLSDTYRTLYPTSSFKITEDSMDSGSSGSPPIVAVSVMQFLTQAQRCFCTTTWYMAANPLGFENL